MPRQPRSFARRVLISQLAVIVLVLALSATTSAWLGSRAVAQTNATHALSTARTLAEDPQLRQEVTKASAQDRLDVEVLREVLVGLLQDDPTLEPRDVLVMCPDIETYAPLVQAARGEAELTAYRFGTGAALHLFCRVCGVKSFYHPRSHPDGISINAHALDGDGWRELPVDAFDGRNWEQARAAL